MCLFRAAWPSLATLVCFGAVFDPIQGLPCLAGGGQGTWAQVPGRCRGGVALKRARCAPWPTEALARFTSDILGTPGSETP